MSYLTQFWNKEPIAPYLTTYEQVVLHSGVTYQLSE